VGDEKQFKMKYMVCLDESAHARKAFEKALRLVRPNEDSLLLLHVAVYHSPLLGLETELSRLEKKQVQTKAEKLITEFLLLARKCGVRGPRVGNRQQSAC
jgi:hypothetical protein